MANIATVLKEEIARLARKELRVHVEGIKKASSQYRRDIAALKRQLTKMERQVALLEGKVLNKRPKLPEDRANQPVRFTAKGLRSQRKRLGFSAADYSKLVGVTALSIYNWEKGTTRPRKAQLSILAALRGMGKKEAKARVRQLTKPKPGVKKGSTSKTSATPVKESSAAPDATVAGKKSVSKKTVAKKVSRKKPVSKKKVAKKPVAKKAKVIKPAAAPSTPSAAKPDAPKSDAPKES